MCNYCDENLITPYSEYNLLVESLIKRKNYNSLKMLIKISPVVESYILQNHLELYSRVGPIYFSNIINKDHLFFSIRLFLFYSKSNKSNDLVLQCNFCLKYSCEFHSIYSNFKHYKCALCKKFVSKCGYCIIFTNMCLDCMFYKPEQDILEFVGL